MSQALIGIQPTQNYIGTVSRYPIRQSSGYRPLPNELVPPSVVPVFIDWNVYWTAANFAADVAVEVNLQAASVQASILDRIALVKIDNTGSPVPVYIWFKDTNDVVTCPPNAAIAVPVLTNNLTATILTQGLTAGNIPQVRVFFANVILPPILDPEINQSMQLWKASPSITRGSNIFNTNFGMPALGDQSINYSYKTVAIGVAQNNKWGSPYPSGFIYLTHVNFTVAVLPAASATLVMNVESTGVSGILYTFECAWTQWETLNVLNLSAMNIKLDATETWRTRIVSASGFNGNGLFNETWNYTVNPY